MERIISPGASLSSIKGRRHRLYRIEKDDELEGDFGISAANEGEVKVKKNRVVRRTIRDCLAV